MNGNGMFLPQAVSSVNGMTGDVVVSGLSAANALNSATTVVNVSSATAPSTGQVLTATSPTAATWQTPSGGGTLPFVARPMYGGSIWWPTVVAAGNSAAGFPTNWEITWPAIYSNDFTIDQIAIQVTTAVAGAAFRVGIYNDSGANGLPGNLITEFTSTTQFDGSTTGIKSITASYSFTKGTVYWWQIHTLGTASIKTYLGVPRPALRSLSSTDALAPISRLCFERNRGSYEPMSSTWVSTGFAAAEQHPAVAVRVV